MLTGLEQLYTQGMALWVFGSTEMTGVKIDNKLSQFPPSFPSSPSLPQIVKGTGKEEQLVSRGANTCRAGPRRGPIRSNAFWGEITQTQRVPEKAPPHPFAELQPTGESQGFGHQGKPLPAPEADSPVSSLVALSFLNSFLF